MHHNGNCPAKGKQCRKCNEVNHFAKVCRSQRAKGKPKDEQKECKHIRPIQRGKESDNWKDEEDLYAVNVAKSPKVNVTVCNHSFKAMIDTGATVNMINQNTYKQMTGVHREKTKMKAFAESAKQPVKSLESF